MIVDEACRIGMPYTIIDKRPKLPEPNLKGLDKLLLAPQRDWLVEALMKDESGLVGGPTRWGKTYGIAGACMAYKGLKVVVIVPGEDLCQQMHEDLCKILPGRDIALIYGGGKKRQSEDVTVCSADSTHYCDYDSTQLVLLDEPHSLVSESRQAGVDGFKFARRLAFGATLEGRFDGRDIMMVGMFGPILANRTYLEGVALGVISPLKVAIVNIPFSKDTLPGNPNRDTVYDRLLRKSITAAKYVRRICEKSIPEHWQTLMFISNEKQADFLMDEVFKDVQGVIAMAKKLKKKERKKLLNEVASGHKLRVLASNIYVQGLTFPDLKVVLNLAGGGASTTAIQKPGRLLQRRPGKVYGVMVDFLFACRDEHLETRKNPPYGGIIGECWSRINKYKSIGYDVQFVDSAEELKAIVDGSYLTDDEKEESARDLAMNPPFLPDALLIDFENEEVEPLGENMTLTPTAEKLLQNYLLQKDQLYARTRTRKKMPDYDHAVQCYGKAMLDAAEVVERLNFDPGVVMEAAFIRARRDKHPDGPFISVLKSEKYLTEAMSYHLQLPLANIRQRASKLSLLHAEQEQLDQELAAIKASFDAKPESAQHAHWFSAHVRFLFLVKKLGPFNAATQTSLKETIVSWAESAKAAMLMDHLGWGLEKLNKIVRK